MNLFKEIDPGTASEMNVVIETPRGTRNKYEIDTKTGIVWLDRVLPGAHDYPVEYGLVPQTLSEDGDALDVILLSSFSLLPGVVVPARAVGVMEMIDGGEVDPKILGVPTGDPRFAHIQDLSDVNPHTLREIEHFFKTYKQLASKEVVVNGFKDKSVAATMFENARKAYQDKQ
jgi:inorganic pyrophosphatase